MHEEIDESFEFPEGIAPHEGRELELMLASKKPLAMFSEVLQVEFPWPDEEFAPYVEQGLIIKQEFIDKTSDGLYDLRHLYYALPNEAWRIEKIHPLTLTSYGGWCEQAAADCAEIGRLLGYSEKDIQAFLDWNPV